MKQFNDVLNELGFKETFEKRDFTSVNRCFTKRLIKHEAFSLNYCHSLYEYQLIIILQKKEALTFSVHKFKRDLAKKGIRASFVTEQKSDEDIRFITFHTSMIIKEV